MVNPYWDYKWIKYCLSILKEISSREFRDSIVDPAKADIFYKNMEKFSRAIESENGIRKAEFYLSNFVDSMQSGQLDNAAKNIKLFGKVLESFSEQLDDIHKGCNKSKLFSSMATKALEIGQTIEGLYNQLGK